MYLSFGLLGKQIMIDCLILPVYQVVGYHWSDSDQLVSTQRNHRLFG